MSSIVFSQRAFEDYIYWQVTDKSTLKKINALIKDITRNGLSTGTGKPELLRYRKEWSRRINHEDRLVYNNDENGNLIIVSCRGHYDD